jgi:hypothetical protein
MLLYASSQMPAADGAMAVGFGSNLPGSKKLPPDFQHPSGKSEGLPFGSNPPSSDDKSQDWHDRILSSSYSRRIPGILIVLLIIALAVYLLCGRERRLTLWHRVLTLTGRRPGTPRPRRRKNGPGGGLLSSKLNIFHSNHEPSYERVLEEAEPSDFELASVHSSEEHHSDSSTDAQPTRHGRTSGLATPVVTRGLSPDVPRSSPKHKAHYFDNASFSSASSSASNNNALGITPFDRGGLIVRADSKERLAPREPLGRSRTASPKRSPLIMPISPYKESVD